MRIDINGVIVPNDDAWVYDWLDMDCTCPKIVNAALLQADGKDIDIYINSGGGDIFAGSEIYSAIRAYSGTVNIHITGLAASAASVIACAAHSDISPTAMVMVHNVSSYARGDYHVMEKEAEVLQKANRAMCSAYMLKCGMTEQEALELMNKETWMSAKEAVDIGLIDEITPPQNQPLGYPMAAGVNILPRSVIDKIKTEIKGAADTSTFDLEKEKLNLLKLKGEQRDEI